MKKEKRYAEFLIDPEIIVMITGFKGIRVLAKGELRNPGFYKFPAYSSVSFIKNDKRNNSGIDLLMENNNEQSNFGQNLQSKNQSSQGLEVKDKNSWLLFWGSDDWANGVDTFDQLNQNLIKLSHLNLDFFELF